MQYMQAWYEIIWNFRQRHLAQQEQDWKKVPCPHVSPGCQKAKGLVYSLRKFEPPPHRCVFFFQQTIWSQSDFHWCARAQIGLTAIGYKQCNHCSPALFFFHEPHYRFGSNATMYTDRIASYHHLKILPFENATWHHAWELREIYGETDKCTYMLTIAAAMLQSTQLWFHIARSNPWEKPVLHGTMGGFIQPTLERYFFETFVLLIYCKFVLGGAPTKL